ncbi:hypothetical protein F5X96DRAFT_674446 [Biscogniauxia mediterranea]|nr:hypothetical protein F5X96DRAFT_674446 [Biscogniauxia mediterranea]
MPPKAGQRHRAARPKMGGRRGQGADEADDSLTHGEDTSGLTGQSTDDFTVQDDDAEGLEPRAEGDDYEHDDDDIEMGEGDVGDDESDSEPDSDAETEEEILVDADRARYGDTEDLVDHTVRAALELDDVVGAASYEEILFAEEPPTSLAFQDQDEDLTSETLSAESESEAVQETAPAPIPPELLPQPKDDPDDPSELITMHQNKFIEMSKFEKALATFADLTGLSREDWKALRETLFLLRDKDGNVLEDVANLPKQLSTLRDRMRKRLPLMNMREADIPLNVLKLPTLPASLKPEEKKKIEAYRELMTPKDDKGKGKARARVTREDKDAMAKDLPVVTMKLTFFDPISVFKNYIASDIGQRTHHGPAIFVDEPTELFHSHAWASSVRTTDGHYAHIWIEDGSRGPVIFPSDFIYFRCTEDGCFCHAIENGSDNVTDLHIGRVYGVGWDKRKKSCTHDMKDQLAIQIQEAHRIGSAALSDTILAPEQTYDELVLTSKITYIPETKAYAQVHVFVDNHFGEDHTDPSWQAPKRRPGARETAASKPYPKYFTASHAYERDENHYYYTRRIVVGDRVVPLCHTHPTRAELELDCYGRYTYENEWDRDREGTLPVKSFPILSFIDGFGVFSNSYRTLMGFYFTPAAMTETERARPGSIFPIVLGPHASEFSDVIAALRTMAYLDQGIVQEINGQEVRTCAFTMCYIGDMPQQAENSGLKGPRAHRFCRCCHARSGQKAVDPEVLLRFDIVTHGRFHVQTTEMQSMMKNQLTNASAVARYGKQWGMSNPDPPLVTISPALDLIITRPFDAAHSEYNGISNLMHFLLRDGILVKAARTEYAMELRVWPFPPGWRRLQSPIHHLASYKMSNHAEWSIIIPALLRHWLKREHMKPRFYDEAYKHTDQDPVDLVVETCAAIAKSNTVLMGRKVSSTDRENMAAIIHRARFLFNQLCMFAAVGAGSVAGSIAGSVVGTPSRTGRGDPVVDTEEAAESGRSLQYMNDTLRPNIHIGIHYPAFAEEYALPVNCNTLTGENLHRYFKTRVYETNYSNVEKVLLMKLNFQETVRLVLRNAFLHDDPELTQEMMELYHKCPSLFSKVLSRADRNELETLLEDTDFELDVDQSANSTHVQPSAINRVPPADARKSHHVANEGERLPSRTNTSTQPLFRRLLRLAYEHDYGKPSQYPSAFENKTIQWSRKFSFTDRATNDRFTFSMGDYVQFSRDGENRFGRVDHIFVLDNFDDRHIFIILTPVRSTNARDALLDLEVMEEQNDDAIIVGVTAIAPVRLYMVKVDSVGIVWVNWELHYL